MDKVTPCDIPDATARYAERDPNQDVTSLYQAKEIRSGIITKHRDTQVSLRREAEDDKAQFDDAVAVIDPAIQQADQLQAVVVGDETHPMSILGLLAGLAGGGFLGGRLLQRPQDYNEDEHQADLAKAAEEAFRKGVAAASSTINHTLGSPT
jgi:hypothetical protein